MASDLPLAVLDFLDRQRRTMRKLRATKAAHALHAKDPDAGRRAGVAASRSFPGGASAWGKAMALKRHRGVPLALWGEREATSRGRRNGKGAA
ncbi:MAG: hypothetical protein WBD55_00010 [Dehalococcoidia bacterium]